MPLPIAEVSPQLLGDMRERSEIENTGDAPDSGLELLEDMKDRLSLEGLEIQRMQDEGGLTLKPSQEAKANECLKASQRIKTVLRAAYKKPRAQNTPSKLTQLNFKESIMKKPKKGITTKDTPKPDGDVSPPPMDGAISAAVSIATVGAAVGAAIGGVGGPVGVVVGAAIGGSVGALAGVEATTAANHAEEVANEEGAHPTKPLPKAGGAVKK